MTDIDGLTLPEGLLALPGKINAGMLAPLAEDLGNLAANSLFESGAENTSGVLGSMSTRFEAVKGNLTGQTVRLLEGLGVADWHQLVFNYQNPLAAQDFHVDGSNSMVIHFEGSGSLDYAPGAETRREAEANFLSLDLDPGTIVLNSTKFLFHRGRNRGTEPRLNLVAFSVT